MQFENYQIRLLEERDADDFYRLIHKNLHRLDFFSGTVSRTKTLEHTRQYVQEIMEKIRDRIYYPHLITDTDNGKIIALMDLKNIDWNIPKGELGCFIDEDYANKKISYNVMKLFTEHAFNEMGIYKLFLRTHTENTPARRLAEKCGFKAEGIIRRDYKTSNGELVDLVYYGLLKDE